MRTHRHGQADMLEQSRMSFLSAMLAKLNPD